VELFGNLSGSEGHRIAAVVKLGLEASLPPGIPPAFCSPTA
jgi:hypothetical protein